MTARRHRNDAPLRAVVYARYSTNLQREDSIEGQVEVCPRVIDRQGWTFARAYDDRAMSGSTCGPSKPLICRAVANAARMQFSALSF